MAPAKYYAMYHISSTALLDAPNARYYRSCIPLYFVRFLSWYALCTHRPPARSMLRLINPSIHSLLRIIILPRLRPPLGALLVNAHVPCSSPAYEPPICIISIQPTSCNTFCFTILLMFSCVCALCSCCLKESPPFLSLSETLEPVSRLFFCVHFNHAFVCLVSSFIYFLRPRSAVLCVALHLTSAIQPALTLLCASTFFKFVHKFIIFFLFILESHVHGSVRLVETTE